MELADGSETDVNPENGLGYFLTTSPAHSVQAREMGRKGRDPWAEAGPNRLRSLAPIVCSARAPDAMKAVFGDFRFGLRNINDLMSPILAVRRAGGIRVGMYPKVFAYPCHSVPNCGRVPLDEQCRRKQRTSARSAETTMTESVPEKDSIPEAPGVGGISSAEITRLLDKPTPIKQVFDALPVGVVILDRDRNIVFLNTAAQALTGYSRKEAVGLPCMYVVRSGACDRSCPVAALTADSEPCRVETDVVNRLRRRIAVRVTAAPLTDADGNLTGYIESIEDIHILKDLDRQLGRDPSFEHIIGQSPEMKKVFDILPAIAKSDSSVLITGETGTGKDFVAEAIHNASERASGSFIKVNCGALPESLLESELFGHVKGAFTGAVENKPGRFKLAHNGTLYLTEIGDLPLPSQVKLLMFLDDQVVFPVGGVKGYRVNVRVIAATHRNLEAMAKQGLFREDLLFRLNVVRIHLPALRERRDDTLLLMDHFLANMAERLHKQISGFTPEARALLSDYPYPGNVRELRNIIEYAANVCDGAKITSADLPAYLTQAPAPPVERDMEADPSERFEPDRVAPSERKETTWPAAERRLIMDALIRAGGKKQRAADILGWGRSTLWRKIKKHGIDATEESESSAPDGAS